MRHALGATLMQEGRYADAAKVYREDLAWLPGNGWSLFGLSRSLQLQQRGPEAERFVARFETAWANANVSLSSSCYCQPGV